MHTYTTQDFRNWVLSQTNELYTIEQLDNFSHSILLKAQNYTGRVNFYPEDVTELVITKNDTEENKFYLHFQPKEKEHSEELFNEMVSALLNLTNVHGLTITLSCTSGLTTGFFTDKLNETVALMGMDYHFNAVPYSNLYERGKDSDMILLSPQISYEYKRITAIFPDKLIIKIPPAIFGGYKVNELITLINEEFKKQEERKTNPKEPVTIREVFNNDYRILTIGLINNEKNYRFPYRIYDHGKVTLDKEVIKTEYTLRDIDDLLNYIMVRHKNIDAIAIAMPGVTYHGILTNVDDPTPIEIPLGLDYTKKFNIPCLLCNDVNAMALGYYALNEDADNMLFYF
ncbi:MAG: ROK family protein, partial [Erysipelotrichaceae bacterium]|nr:ROK family protein [Erysipelotrichaceae bacterium]